MDGKGKQIDATLVKTKTKDTFTITYEFRLHSMVRDQRNRPATRVLTQKSSTPWLVSTSDLIGVSQ